MMHAAERRGMSRILCRSVYEERIAEDVKSIPTAYYNYVQSKTPLRKTVSGVKNYQWIRLPNNREKADYLLKFSQALCRRAQGTQGRTLGPGTLLVGINEGAITQE